MEIVPGDQGNQLTLVWQARIRSNATEIDVLIRDLNIFGFEKFLLAVCALHPQYQAPQKLQKKTIYIFKIYGDCVVFEEFLLIAKKDLLFLSLLERLEVFHVRPSSVAKLCVKKYNRFENFFEAMEDVYA